jgi:hypothetical protein
MIYKQKTGLLPDLQKTDLVPDLKYLRRNKGEGTAFD